MVRSLLVCGCCLLLFPATALAAEGFTVRFPLASADLSPAARAEVADLAARLRQVPGQRVILAGHADSSGPHDFNVRLSHDRAASVRRLLVEEYRIAPARIGITWLDSSQPAASNTSAAGRARNRRVGIAFLGGGATEQRPPLAAPVPRSPASVRPAKETVEAVIQRSTSSGPDPREELALSYPPGATQLGEADAEKLAAFAKRLKQAPGQRILLTGLTPRGGDLLTTRRRVDAVKNLLLYVHGIASRQVMTAWSDNSASDADLLLQSLE